MTLSPTEMEALVSIFGDFIMPIDETDKPMMATILGPDFLDHGPLINVLTRAEIEEMMNESPFTRQEIEDILSYAPAAAAHLARLRGAYDRQGNVIYVKFA